jgi:hypothetical protein
MWPGVQATQLQRRVTRDDYVRWTLAQTAVVLPLQSGFLNGHSA